MTDPRARFPRGGNTLACCEWVRDIDCATPVEIFSTSRGKCIPCIGWLFSRLKVKSLPGCDGFEDCDDREADSLGEAPTVCGVG